MRRWLDDETGAEEEESSDKDSKISSKDV